MRPDQSALEGMSNSSRIILVIAAVAAIVGLLGVFVDIERFFQAYLVGFVLWAEVAMACLGIVLLNSLVNARWLYTIQRFAEAGARTMPLLALLFIPIAIGLGTIYPGWGWGAETALEGGKAIFLQPVFFILRTYIYFAVWTWFAYRLTSWSYAADPQEHYEFGDRQRNFAAVAAVFYVLTTSLAGFDWTMSLLPEWFSSVWGWLALARAVLTGFSLLLVLVAFSWGSGLLAQAATDRAKDDLAALLLVSLLVYCYMHVVQFIIIWAGNVTYFVEWYDVHNEGTWLFFTQFMVISHAIAIVLLLMPGFKRSRALVTLMAAVIFGLRIIGMYWVVMPAYGEFALSIWDFAPVIAIGGAWLFLMFWNLGQYRIVAVHHPVLAHDATYEPGENPEQGYSYES